MLVDFCFVRMMLCFMPSERFEAPCTGIHEKVSEAFVTVSLGADTAFSQRAWQFSAFSQHCRILLRGLQGGGGMGKGASAVPSSQEGRLHLSLVMTSAVKAQNLESPSFGPASRRRHSCNAKAAGDFCCHLFRGNKQSGQWNLCPVSVCLCWEMEQTGGQVAVSPVSHPDPEICLPRGAHGEHNCSWLCSRNWNAV